MSLCDKKTQIVRNKKETKGKKKKIYIYRERERDLPAGRVDSSKLSP